MAEISNGGAVAAVASSSGPRGVDLRVHGQADNLGGHITDLITHASSNPSLDADFYWAWLRF
jgi:hypothetical protein